MGRKKRKGFDRMYRDSLSSPLKEFIESSAIERGHRVLYIGSIDRVPIDCISSMVGEDGELMLALPISSHDMKEEKKEENIKIYPIPSNISRLPFSDGTFDRILLKIPSHSPFLDGNDSIFREFYRVLKKNGKLLLLTKTSGFFFILDLVAVPIRGFTKRRNKELVSIFWTLEKAGFWDIIPIKEVGLYSIIQGNKYF